MRSAVTVKRLPQAEIVSLFGDSLGPNEVQSASLENGLRPRSLAGSSVKINGPAAPIFYSQTGRLNLLPLLP